MARSKYKKHETDAPFTETGTKSDRSGAETEPVVEISRSAKKRESDAMKALGMQLAELSPRQLQELALSDALFKAVTDYQRITSNSAKRRQRGFIGGLLRDDTDAAQAIIERYTALTQHDADAKRVHHQLEDWRERLIADDAALTAFMEEYRATPDNGDTPEFSVQELRTMIRRARTAKDDAQRKKATKALYRKLAHIAQA